MKATAAAICLALALGACQSPQIAGIQPYGALPAQAYVDDVPFFAQETNYCGPAALAMVLAWSGLEVTQQDVAHQVYTPGREGTLQTDILAAARRQGRLALAVTTPQDLLKELAAGHPVLVFQNLGLSWYPKWHYAVALGYDVEKDLMVLHSGLDAHRRMSFGTFLRTWEKGGNWALVVLPPSELPATGDEAAWLQAATALERARRYDDAAAAYLAISDRRPGSLGALVGLANAHYAAGRLPLAADALTNALAHHPDAAPAWNNYAYVLDDMGERTEAVAAAREAVRLGRGDPAYRETLKEIEEASVQPNR